MACRLQWFGGMRMPMPVNPVLLLASSVMASLLACTAPAPDEEQAPPDIEQAPPSASETTASWQAPANAELGILASAWANDEGAVAYTERDASDSGGSATQTRIKLQRLDGSGALRGSPIELGVVESNWLSRLTLAGDGERYIACWASDGRIDCATAPAGAGGASKGLSLAGGSPSLAYGSGRWALAYGVAGKLAVVRLAKTGMVDGSPAMFEAAGDPYFEPLPLLAATPQGFVLVGGEPVRVHTLDLAFSPISGAVDLGVTPWAFAAVAASGTNMAIFLSVPYGSNLFLFQDGALTATLPFAGGGKGGLNAALTEEGDSFGMLAPYVDAQGYSGEDLVYRMIEAGGASISERAQDVEFNVVDDGSRALLRLKEDVLVAAISQRKEVVVARIHRP
jgi:hypothetical protein